MLNNKIIIDTLTTRQKIYLLSDWKNCSEREIAAAGVPEFKSEEFSFDGFPTYEELACSFNEELLENIGNAVATQAKSRGVNALKMPAAKVKTSGYTLAATEDPYLASSYARGLARGAQKASVSPIAKTYEIEEEDREYCDEALDERTEKEMFLASFRRALNGGDSIAIAAEKGQREKFLYLLSDKVRKEVGFIGVSPEDPIKTLLSGYTALEGASTAKIENAVARYQRISEDIKKGEALGEDLTSACRKGEAISPETLDECVDKIIDYIRVLKSSTGKASAREYYPSSEPVSDRKVYAAAQSIVLLKNENNVLPLTNQKLAVFGRAKYAEGVKIALGNAVTGVADGYHPEGERDDEYLIEARSLMDVSDVAIVLLEGGTQLTADGRFARTLSIPAPQIALLKELSATGKKIVAILPCGAEFDVSFDGVCSAILLAPFSSEKLGEALADVLTGKVSPSGRLPYSLHKNADRYYSGIKEFRSKKNNKIGPFIGYRRYDSMERPAAYPFGYGLSYGKFVYSGLNIRGNKIAFTVKNKGKIGASEVVQIYIGKKDSSVLRPKKELKAVRKIYLKKGGSAHVEITLDREDLEIYDDKTRRYCLEGGNYEIYVASSLMKVELTGAMSVNGEKLSYDHKKPSQYLDNASNILAGGYAVSPKVKKMKKGNKAMIFLSIAVALFGIVLLLIGNSQGAGSYLTILGIMVGILGALGMVTFIYTGSKNAEYVSVKAENDDLVEKEKIPSDPAIRALFEKEFKEVKPVFTEKKREESTKKKKAVEYFDNNLKVEIVREDLISYARDHGLVLGKKDASALVEGMMTARLLFIQGEDRLVERLLAVIGRYFASDVFMDDASEYLTADDLLGRNGSSSFMRALYAAKSDASTVFPALLKNVNLKNTEYLIPYLAYFKNPVKDVSVTSSDTRKDDIVLPHNLWMICSVQGKFSDMPSYIAEIASVISPEIGECEKSANVARSEKVELREFDTLARFMREKYELGEEYWKKVDKFESYVAQRAAFKVGNKETTFVEKYVALALSEGREEKDALDRAFATRILPEAMLALKGKRKEDDKSVVEVLEDIFGEDNVAYSKKIARAFDEAARM